MSDAEEENDRQQGGGAEPDDGCHRRVARTERRADVAEVRPGQRHATHDPGGRKNHRHQIGGSGRAILQRAQDLADRLLVVIGRMGARAADRTADVFRLEPMLAVERRAVAPLVMRMMLGELLGLTARQIVAVIPHLQSLLNRRERRLGRIHDLLRIVGHVGCRLANYAGLGRPSKTRPHQRARVDPLSTHPHEDFPRPHVLLPETILVVWRNEENRIGNHPLIIVNALTTWLPCP